MNAKLEGDNGMSAADGSKWIRRFALGLAVVVLAFAALNFWGAWREYSLTSSLRSRGEVTNSRLVRTNSSTTPRSGGNSSSSHYGVWQYTVAGKSYEVIDQGNHYSGAPVKEARLGPEAPDQIVYLPDNPARARLRSQLEPEYFDLLGGGLALSLAGFVLIWFARRGGKRRG
jgi:hypothetical protein